MADAQKEEVSLNCFNHYLDKNEKKFKELIIKYKAQHYLLIATMYENKGDIDNAAEFSKRYNIYLKEISNKQGLLQKDILIFYISSFFEEFSFFLSIIYQEEKR